MHCGSHVAVAAGSCNVEQTHPFHEERALLGIENRETLIDFHLEGIAFHLAEVRIDGSIKSDIGSNTEFSAQTDVGFMHRVIPLIRCGTSLTDTVRDAGENFD